jgi:RNA polymerase sigma-70 factor (ECF subfamily)
VKEDAMPEVKPDSAQTRALLDRAGGGDQQARDELLQRYQLPLHKFIDLRLDPAVRARLGTSDVVQEAQMEVARRLDDYLRRRPMPFHLWVRKTAYQRLLDAHRAHRRDCRSVRREQALPDRSSLAVARPLLARGPSPSQEAQAREMAARVAEAVAGLSEADREVLLMRHAEELPYEEIACLLDIEPAAARKRYGRALLRLERALAERGLVEERT